METVFFVEIEDEAGSSVKTCFTRAKDRGFDVAQTTYFSQDIGKYTIHADMSSDEATAAFNSMFDEASKRLGLSYGSEIMKVQAFVKRDRSFLAFTIISASDLIFSTLIAKERGFSLTAIREAVHLPGLRGNPERTYPVTAVETEFSGTFENYVASILGQWQTDGKNEKLASVNRDLKRLGLTGRVSAKSVNDTQVELRVNRLLRGDDGSTEDMVNIADVGLGVSQTLPVVVALHVARPGQLIYLEQPEIHLHPRAQVAMAEVLADAAIQGKRLVVETHSSLLLLGIQTLVAEGKLPPELVKLHWFAQQEDGSTQITSADLDNTGSFGDWPEDFDDVELYSEKRYLDAAQARLRGKKQRGARE